MNNGKFAQWIFVFTLSGYPIVTGISRILSIDNRMISITSRAVVLALALLVILCTIRSRLFRDRYFWPSWWCFWILYVSRIGIDFISQPETLKLPPYEYLAFAIGASLIPAVAMATGNSVRIVQGAPATLVWVTSIGLILNLWIIFIKVGSISALQFKVMRLEHEGLNPITIGHMGVTLFMLCLWEMRFGSCRSIIHRGLYRALLFGAIVLSIVAIVAAGSRGPVISLFLALSVLAILRGTRLLNIWTILVVTGLAVTVWWSASQGESFFLTKRLSNLFLDAGRETLLSQGFRTFMDSPIIGSGINPTKTYPHNLVLESFMAFGVFTGIPFTFLLVYANAKALQLARLQPNSLWVTLLFVQYSVAGMFSGALYFSSALWVLMVLVVALAKAGEAQVYNSQRMPRLS